MSVSSSLKNPFMKSCVSALALCAFVSPAASAQINEVNEFDTLDLTSLEQGLLNNNRLSIKGEIVEAQAGKCFIETTWERWVDGELVEVGVTHSAPFDCLGGGFGGGNFVGPFADVDIVIHVGETAGGNSINDSSSDGEEEEVEEEDEEENCSTENSTSPNDLSLEELQEMFDFNSNGITELQVAIFGSIHAGAIVELAWNARQRAGELYPNDSYTLDAFRHIYWSYSLTSIFGPQLAEAFTNAHEVTGNNNNQPIGELYMDFHNNAIGRILFEIHGNRDLRGAEVLNLIIDAINNNAITEVPTSCEN